MHVPCEACGADLRLNPQLAGSAVSCPQCGAKVVVPKPGRRSGLQLEPDPEPPPQKQKKLKLPLRFTFWLMGAQVALAALGLTCLAAAFYKDSWGPPAGTYFQANPIILAAVGLLLIASGWLAHYLPVLTTLFVSLLVFGACALGVWTSGRVDASRTLALSLSMLALWLALQHRRANAR